MPDAVLAPGARIECRSAEWLVRSLCRSSDGQQVVDVVGVSPFLKEKEARFLVDVSSLALSRTCHRQQLCAVAWVLSDWAAVCRSCARRQLGRRPPM